VLNLLTEHRSLGFHPYSHSHPPLFLIIMDHRTVTQFFPELLVWRAIHGAQVRHYRGWREYWGRA
jgi:hypothetical protein